MTTESVSVGMRQVEEQYSVILLELLVFFGPV